MTAETITKLEIAFSNGATDKQACFVAGISERALYEYCVINPEFAQRKEALKEDLKYIAKSTIAHALQARNLEITQWYADRKMKDEGFSTRTEHTGGNGKDLFTGLTDEDKAKLDALVQPPLW